MRAGELRHRVDINAPMGVLSDSAAVEVDADVPMKIEVLPLAFQAREALGLGGVLGSTLYTVTSRYREDIKRSYVLNERCCTQRAFQIVAIIPSDRRDKLELTCVTNG